MARLAPLLVFLVVPFLAPIQSRAAASWPVLGPVLRPEPEQWAEGDRLLQRGIEEVRAERPEAALESLAMAADVFQRAGALPTAAIAEGWLAGALADLDRHGDAARAHAREADLLQAVHQGWDHPQIEMALRFVGLALSRDGRPAEATRYFEAALEMRLRHPDTDNTSDADLWRDLAFCAEDMGHGERALTLHRSCLEALRKKHPESHPDALLALGDVADALETLGRFEEAVELRRDRVRLLEQTHGGEHEDLAAELLSLGVATQMQNGPAAALPFFKRSLAMRRRLHGEEHRGVSAALGLVGFCLQATGRVEESLPLFEQAREISERLYEPYEPDSIDLATARANLALCLHQLGRHVDAMELHEQVLARYARTGEEGAPIFGQVLNNVAFCLAALGRMDEALEMWARSLELHEQFHDGDHATVAMSLANQSLALTLMGRSEEALPLLERALGMQRRMHGDDHQLVAQTRAALAFCMTGLERHVEAESHFRASLERYEALYGEAHPNLVALLTNLGICLDAQGRATEALPLFERAVRIARTNDHPDLHAFAANLGAVLHREGRSAEAVPLLATALAEIEGRRRGARGIGELERSRYVRQLRVFGAFRTMIRAQIALGRPDRALDWLERGRARALLDLLEKSAFSPVDRALERARARGDEARVAQTEAVSRAVSETERDADRVRHALEMARTRADVAEDERREAVDRLEGELIAARRRHRDALRGRTRLVRDAEPLARPERVEDVQYVLQDGEVVLYYALASEGSVALLLPPPGQEVTSYRLAWPESGEDATPGGIRAAVADYVEALSRAQTSTRGLVFPRPLRINQRDSILDLVGRRLFGTLVPDALWARLLEAERVFIVPHGALHRLPFETLRLDAKDGESPRYWMDAGPPIAYVASGSMLRWCRGRREEQGEHRQHVALVALGDPSYRGLPPLPGTRREVESIAATFAEGDREGQVVRLLGAEATEPALFREAPRGRFLHIAAHGLVARGGDPIHAAIALTLPDAPGEKNDGFLELKDLFEHWRDRLCACELVVLSACDTQTGEIDPHEGVFGLPWGFHYAGCPSVVASIWQVEDESTALLMSDLYRRLRDGNGQDKLAAFTAARKALKRTHPDPFHWAPFVYLGEPR